MNINFFDALSDLKALSGNAHMGSESLDVQVDRFMIAQAIMLALVGVPGIYFHSLFGSRGWSEGVAQTGRNRTVNREKCERINLETDLADETSLRAKVFKRYRQLLQARRGAAAFHPYGRQIILDIHPAVFALERVSPDNASRVVCLHNVSAHKISFTTPYNIGQDLLMGRSISLSNLTLEPYQILWVQL